MIEWEGESALELCPEIFEAIAQLPDYEASRFLDEYEQLEDEGVYYCNSPSDDDGGVDLSINFEGDIGRMLVGADKIPLIELTPSDIESDGSRKFGETNPKANLPNFWKQQIRTFGWGFCAARFLEKYRGHKTSIAPVWSFRRFGRSYTLLPDGRWVLIAGEHEDYYDDDFCIYNDVTVFDGRGGVEHFIYPREAFPPTDFHTATLVGKEIWIIGCLGYREDRDESRIQVLRLDTNDFSVRRVQTVGEVPGWISRHAAMPRGNAIEIEGGQVLVDDKLRKQTERYVLDIATLNWSKMA